MKKRKGLILCTMIFLFMMIIVTFQAESAEVKAQNDAKSTVVQEVTVLPPVLPYGNAKVTVPLKIENVRDAVAVQLDILAEGVYFAEATDQNTQMTIMQNFENEMLKVILFPTLNTEENTVQINAFSGTIELEITVGYDLNSLARCKIRYPEFRIKNVVISDLEGKAMPVEIARDEKDSETESAEEQLVKPTSPVPDEYMLIQNYPNPFNPETNIGYGLPEDANVNVTVFNIIGQEVITLVNAQQPAGYHTVQWDAGFLPSGVYFYRIAAGEFTATKKMVLMK